MQAAGNPCRFIQQWRGRSGVVVMQSLHSAHCAEQQRLLAARDPATPWKKWGPCLSERRWGSVREICSDKGDAWNDFSHDQARSRAYHWGEDLMGICDDHQILCFALTVWNGNDPILKKRAFGLTNHEGNQGEDVKKVYFCLDSSPPHSYLKALYKYPQAASPYEDLVVTKRRRGRCEPEYELLDAGVFDGDRHFDVTVEYAKANGPEDILIRIGVCNRGPKVAVLHVLPTLWCRNTCSWAGGGSRPVLRQLEHPSDSLVEARHSEPLYQSWLGDYFLSADQNDPLLFTKHETNHARLFGGINAGLSVKDGNQDDLVHGRRETVTPALFGSKVSVHDPLHIAGGSTQVLRLRLTRSGPERMLEPLPALMLLFSSASRKPMTSSTGSHRRGSRVRIQRGRS